MVKLYCSNNCSSSICNPGKLDASIVIALFLASDRVIYPFRNVSNYLRMIQSTEPTRKKLEKMLQDSQQQEVSENHIDESILAA